MIAIIAMSMFADLEFYTTRDADKTEQVRVSYSHTSIEAKNGKSTHLNTALFSLLGVSAIIALISILSFKNRKLQASMISFNFGAVLGILALMYFYSFYMDYINEANNTLQIWIIIPLFLLFFNYLALRAVLRDERLIRSMERFR